MAGQAVMVVELGCENCSVVEREPSERVNPAAEKSAQVKRGPLDIPLLRRKKKEQNMSHKHEN